MSLLCAIARMRCAVGRSLVRATINPRRCRQSCAAIQRGCCLTTAPTTNSATLSVDSATLSVVGATPFAPPSTDAQRDLWMMARTSDRSTAPSTDSTSAETAQSELFRCLHSSLQSLLQPKLLAVYRC